MKRFKLFLLCCFVVSTSSGQTINAIEYWFDAEFAGRTQIAVTSAPSVNMSEFNTVALSEGLHTVNFRAKDNDNRWSVTHSQLFYKLPAVVSGVELSAYEYWVDESYAAKVNTNIAGTTLVLNTGFDVSGLSEGLHKINIRMKDANNRWSVTHSQLFYKLPAVVSGVELSAYEYWIDESYAAKVNTNTTGATLVLNTGFDVSGLSEGLHKINIRMKDANNRWSVTHSQLFYKLPAVVSGVELSAYEYWIDESYAGKVNTNITGATLVLNTGLDVSSLSEGLHKINIRMKDANNRWSVTHSQLFYKLPAVVSGVELSAYEYWIDESYAAKVNTNITGATLVLNTGLDVSSLSEGLHKINIRMKDANNRWSVTHSQLFYKLPAVVSGVELSAYEYWIDESYAGKVNTNITGATLVLNTGFDVSSLSEGLHKINIRMKDANNRWSVTHSQLFYKNAVNPVGINKINAYRYWFDNFFASQQFVDFSVPISPCELITDISMPSDFVLGESHLIHFQFRDVMNKWSVACTDTFDVSTFTENINLRGGLSVYLNPFEEYILLRNTQFSGKTNISVFNSIGVCVFSKVIDLTANTELKIEIGSDLCSGVYLLILDNGIVRKQIKLSKK